MHSSLEIKSFSTIDKIIITKFNELASCTHQQKKNLLAPSINDVTDWVILLSIIAHAVVKIKIAITSPVHRNTYLPKHLFTCLEPVLWVIMLLGQCMHDSEPGLSWYVPAGHSMQRFLLPRCVPLGHRSESNILKVLDLECCRLSWIQWSVE